MAKRPQTKKPSSPGSLPPEAGSPSERVLIVVAKRDLGLRATAEGVATVKPGTKLEFSVIDSRKGPQAMSIHIIDTPVSLSDNSRTNNDDLAAMIEDTIKILDRVGNGLRQGRHPSGPEAERLGRVLRGIASQLEA